MAVQPRLTRSILAIAACLTGCSSTSESTRQARVEVENKQLALEAFERWRAGTGGPFELLADDARWTIVGSSPASKTYASKAQFMSEVIRPFNARMAQPLKPTLRHVLSDRDTVAVAFDAESTCLDDVPYRNTYAWFMRFDGGRVVDVTAFLDTRRFDEMWTRVAPR